MQRLKNKLSVLHSHYFHGYKKTPIVARNTCWLCHKQAHYQHSYRLQCQKCRSSRAYEAVLKKVENKIVFSKKTVERLRLIFGQEVREGSNTMLQNQSQTGQSQSTRSPCWSSPWHLERRHLPWTAAAESGPSEAPTLAKLPLHRPSEALSVQVSALSCLPLALLQSVNMTS